MFWSLEVCFCAHLGTKTSNNYFMVSDTVKLKNCLFESQSLVV